MIGTSGDAHLLIADGGEMDRALDAGELVRFKLRGHWLYTQPDSTLEQALNEAERASSSCLEEWLLGTNPILSNTAAKRTASPEITGRAMTVLTQELCFRGLLGGLGLISQGYQPYVAFFRSQDAEEIVRQLGELRQLVARHRTVDWRDLPEPMVGRPGKAWRSILLAHAEYLGMGRMPDRSQLIRWEP